MSGSAGIIHFDGRPVEPNQVEAMTAAMRTRGPDGIHHWCRGNVALGQCMLRTRAKALVIGYCDRHRNVAQIQESVLREHPNLFPSAGEITRFVDAVLGGNTE